MTDLDMWADLDQATDAPGNTDRAAEAAVLGACMLNPALLDEIRLTGGDFDTPAHGIVWAALQAMHTDGTPIDATTVVGYLADTGELTRVGGGIAVAGLLEACPSPLNGPYYAERVTELARRRAVADYVRTATGIANSTADADRMLDVLRTRLDAIDDTATDDGPKHWADIITEGMDAIEQAAAGGDERGIPTGLVDLDRVLGGLKPGDITIIGGRPGSGKSTLAMQIAAHVALDLEMPSLALSLEMRRPELYNRIVASRMSINLSNLGTGALADHEWSKLARQAGMSADSPLWIDDNPDHTLASISQLARQWKRRHGLRLLVIDYLQLISTPRAENRQVAIAEISRGLKRLASQLDIPIVVAAQLNRGPEQRSNKIPTMADLRESGSLENDASGIVLVHREETTDPDTVRKGEADLLVVKNRNGKQDTVIVASQLHYARFASMAGADTYGGR